MNKYSNDFVSRYYVMDPEVEDILPSGKLLMDGMCVLIEGSVSKTDIAENMREELVNKALINNRWCRVTDITYEDQDRKVVFVGEYADRSRIQRRMPLNFAWLVKKDSYPILSEAMRRRKLLVDIMEKVVQRSYTLDESMMAIADAADVLMSSEWFDVGGAQFAFTQTIHDAVKEKRSDIRLLIGEAISESGSNMELVERARVVNEITGSIIALF